MNPDEIARLTKRLAELGVQGSPSPAEIVRDVVDAIHAARGRGVSNFQLAQELGLTRAILTTTYPPECARRNVEPVRTRTVKQKGISE